MNRKEDHEQPLLEERLPGVAIVILNWNGWRDTIECLESLQKITYPIFQVVVVDNGSTDGSPERITAWARGEVSVQSRFLDYDASSKPVHVQRYDRLIAIAEGGKDINREETESVALSSGRRLVLIQTGENLGFSGGNNVGIRYALRKGFPYILLLNNDTVVARDFLGRLVATGERDKEVGVVGPTIYHYYEPARVWFAGGKLSLRHRMYYPGYGLGNHRRVPSEHEIDFVVGCALLANKEVFERIGLLREEYFFGMEDVEFCLHARGAGFRCEINPDARVWHKAGGSTHDPLHSPMRRYYVTRNAIHYWRSHQGSPFRLVRFFVILGLRGAWHISRWLLTGRFDLILASWRACRDGLRDKMGRSPQY